MGQVNLYKIDEKKTDDFLNKLDEKFQFLESRIIHLEMMKKINVR